MNDAQIGYLLRTIATYVWWKTPDEAIEDPQDVIARIMDIGLLEDVRELLELFSKPELLGVLHNAVLGQFRGQSWHFWHYYLTDCQLGEVPPLPIDRRLHA
jgi:hypothetical protein